MKNILIVGAGYVGLSYACLLSNQNNVYIDEKDDFRREKLKKHESYLEDKDIRLSLRNNKSRISLYDSQKNDLSKFDLIILCLPTNYDAETNFFDLNAFNLKLAELSHLNFKNLIVIKSTVPVGYTEKVSKKYKNLRIIFSPEFLREGSSLKDASKPSRTIAGGNQDDCNKYISIINKSISNETKSYSVKSTEAEAVKLFSNTYLAMRISFFNELDSFAIENSLDAKSIIDGVCSDTRIGEHYNNPSFGYGGYCLPKDTKQLLANYKDIPQDLISSIVNSNTTRKKLIANQIYSKCKNGVVGIYRLLMKKNSDNFRDSSVVGVIENLKSQNMKIIIFEPLLDKSEFNGIPIEKDFHAFTKKIDLIIANRLDESIMNFKNIIFTRDIYKRD